MRRSRSDVWRWVLGVAIGVLLLGCQAAGTSQPEPTTGGPPPGACPVLLVQVHFNGVFYSGPTPIMEITGKHPDALDRFQRPLRPVGSQGRSSGT